MSHSGALGNEGEPPDGRGQKEHGVRFDKIFVHLRECLSKNCLDKQYNKRYRPCGQVENRKWKIAEWFGVSQIFRRGGRVAEGDGLLNRYTV